MRIIRLITRSQSQTRGYKFLPQRVASRTSPIDRELLKYGLKVDSNTKRFYSTNIIMFISFFAGFAYCCHTMSLHDNVLMVIKSNKPFEGLIPRTHQFLYRYFYKAKYEYQTLVALKNLMKSQQTLNIKEEAMVRIQQYQNFKKNRNPRMDFLSIGQISQYPFPNIQQYINKGQGVVTGVQSPI